MNDRPIDYARRLEDREVRLPDGDFWIGFSWGVILTTVLWAIIVVAV